MEKKSEKKSAQKKSSSIKKSSRSKKRNVSTHRDISSATGHLIIIGGREDKEGDRHILLKIAEKAKDGKLVIASVASELAEELWKEYDPIFLRMGVRNIAHLNIDRREEVFEEGQLKILDDASVVFFTGGDQLRITAKLGGTRIASRIRSIYIEGGTIAGTSAGASVMGEIMLVSGVGAESHKVGGSLAMAPGLGLIRDMIIDQHFAQRGRIGRLLGAVAQNPGVLGIGIDEDTAIIVHGKKFQVLGNGAVYAVDGRKVSYTNVSDESVLRTMNMFDVKLHVLASGDTFDLVSRRPKAHSS